jgi:hypothetical protein
MKRDSPSIPRQAKFGGMCDDLKGHIYHCIHSSHADHYMRTTKEIAKYMDKTFKFGMDTLLVIANLEPVVLTVPGNPAEDACYRTP